jgi:hypothetical protein
MVHQVVGKVKDISGYSRIFQTVYRLENGFRTHCKARTAGVGCMQPERPDALESAV